jgi:hypothetical protein
MNFQQDAVREWASITGFHFPEREWLLSDYDTWERNPHYTGKLGRHPEDDVYDEEVVSEMVMPLGVQKISMWQDECPF